MNKWLNFGESPSGYRDCFPDSSILGDTESGINRLRCATLQCRACTSKHRHNNYDLITSPTQDRQPWQTCLGGAMHCSSASSLSNVPGKTENWWKEKTKISPVRDWRLTTLEWLPITRDLDLDLGSGHTAYRRHKLTKFRWNGKNFFLDGLSAWTPPSSRSRDTKSRTTGQI